MERLTGRQRGDRQPEEEPKNPSEQKKAGNAGEGDEKVNISTNFSLGESRGSAGVSVLQPYSQHHHCEHHQSPQPQSHGHRRHFWYRGSHLSCLFFNHSSTSLLLENENDKVVGFCFVHH